MCDPRSTPRPITQGSRRKRLWELPHPCHCPVVGVCIPLPVLRQLVNKALGGQTVADDHEVHVGAVAECTKRSRLSEMLQKDLESRHASAVQRFRSAKDTHSVANLWALAVKSGDVSGALWSALTHPRCDEVLQELVLRDMHMLQHQAIAAVRIDITSVNELIKENGVLGRALGKAQERCTRLINEKSTQIDMLNAHLLQQRAVLIGKDTQITFLTQDLELLRAALPEFENVTKLREKIAQMNARQHELETQNARLRKQVSDAQRPVSLPSQSDVHRPNEARSEVPPEESPVKHHLKDKTILCVGGRNGSVSNYRDVIEKAGGQFAHHDGGLEDKQGALDSVLAAADLVICQTGCISHNAYWRVKDHCKRTGKQCVFVANPSTSTLSRTLQRISTDEASSDAVETGPVAEN